MYIFMNSNTEQRKLTSLATAAGPPRFEARLPPEQTDAIYIYTHTYISVSVSVSVSLSLSLHVSISTHTPTHIYVYVYVYMSYILK